ncbi:glycosyltransferase [Chryseobacterium sp. TY4]
MKIFISKLLFTYPVMLWDKFFPYTLNYTKYTDSFISRKSLNTNANLENAPEVIYLFWTGNNEMSDNRKKGLQTYIEKSDVEVILVTPNNLHDYVLDDYPLHPAYQHLSLVHKADYLRCYFMYHHGGGYSDVKKCHASWSSAFQNLNSSNKYALGYGELSSGSLSVTNTSVDKELRKYFFRNIGMGAFIFKPRSPIAKEWFDELNNVLNSYMKALASHPGNVFGDNIGYPIYWNRILSQILHPVLLKYADSLIQDDSIKPEFKNYR